MVGAGVRRWRPSTAACSRRGRRPHPNTHQSLPPRAVASGAQAPATPCRGRRACARSRPPLRRPHAATGAACGPAPAVRLRHRWRRHRPAAGPKRTQAAQHDQQVVHVVVADQRAAHWQPWPRLPATRRPGRHRCSAPRAATQPCVGLRQRRSRHRGQCSSIRRSSACALRVVDIDRCGAQPRPVRTAHVWPPSRRPSLPW